MIYTLESGNGTCEESESVSVHHHDLHPQSAWEIVTWKNIGFNYTYKILL